MTRSRFLRKTHRLHGPSTTTVVTAGLIAAGTIAAGAAYASWTSTRTRERWRGKTVVITGGSRGLGLALAAEFAKGGANLVLAARDAEELLRARQLLVNRGNVSSESQVLLHVCDLTSRVEAETMIEAATKHWGRVDVLVNNAGIIRVGPAASQTIEDFTDAMNTNFYAMLYCSWAALPQMVARGAGDIINISSFGGKIAVPHMLAYSASKFAATGFSQGLHTEVKPHGVHVTTVCPGLLRTGSHLNAEFKGRQAEEYRWFSLGATLPFVSVDAARAAQLIVSAAARRHAELIISPQAAIGARLAGLLPNTTVAALSFVNWLLPKGGGDPSSSHAIKGAQTRAKEIKLVASRGRAAAARYNELPGPDGVAHQPVHKSVDYRHPDVW